MRDTNPASLNCQDDNATHAVILVFTRDYLCWRCEEALSPLSCGVHAEDLAHQRWKYPLLFLTCGPVCQRHVLRKCIENGLKTEAWTGARIRRLVDNPENIAGSIQDLTLGLVLKAGRS